MEPVALYIYGDTISASSIVFSDGTNLQNWYSSTNTTLTSLANRITALENAGGGGSYEIGSYVGDGTRTRTINLGYRPKAVFVFPDTYNRSGGTSLSDVGSYFGTFGLAIDGVVQLNGQNSKPTIEISNTGFIVDDTHSVSASTFNYAITNVINAKYKYIAFK